MKIGIILHPYDEDSPGGLGRSILERTRALIEIDSKNKYIIFLKNAPNKEPIFSGSNWKLEIVGEGLFWLERLRKKERADLYLFNTPTLPMFWKPPSSIVIAHDFAYLHLGWSGVKDFFRNSALFFYNLLSLHRADKIIAVSHATKKDTEKIFRVASKKIHVIYSGFKRICALPEEAVKLPQKFFLYLGPIKKRKNVFNIVKAFYEFSRTQKEYALVLCGNPRGVYYEKICAYIHLHGLVEKIIFAGFVSDGELSYIYRRAVALVFPSKIEGFGFPVLEAMDCGTPVITSRTSSLGEISKDHSLLVDPEKPSSITDAMSQIVDNASLREKLITKGFSRTKYFSWKNASLELLKIIETT